MSRKKQGSLTGRMGRVSGRSLDTCRENSFSKEIMAKKVQKQACFIDDIIGFVQSYQLSRQVHQVNMNSECIFQQMTPGDITNQDDEQFFFDVDLGVPYVQSHHLDSGFQYEDKTQQAATMSFPKVSSAKQIFTSVLQLDHTQNSQCLQEQNFTDQEEQSQSSFCIRKSAAFNKKKSRKQVPVMMMNNDYESLFAYDVNKTTNSTVPDNSICESSRSIQNQSIVEKLKSTVLSRENKLQYWNQRLIELEDDKNINIIKNNNQIYPTTYNKQQSSSKLTFSPLSSAITQQSKKKIKFQKYPVKKSTITTMVVQVNLNNTNKENITPSRLKLQTKNSQHIKLNTLKEKSNIFNNRLELNQKNHLQIDKQPHKDNKTNLNKDRSFVRKVF